LLEENQYLKTALKKLDLPIRRYREIDLNGILVNTVEILPPDFDSQSIQKYGVLFRVYGGPFSQLVSHEFEFDFSTALASDPEQDLIVVIVDGRGTGFKGTKFRCVVRKNLGELETEDQVNAAKYWSKLPYVNPERIGIWGWSYGAYMAAKAIEADSGVFRLGMSVAPVTDWRFYDTVYTERYMLTPRDNLEGYEKSAVSKMEGFKKVRYLLVHGTADDNVHFQQSVHLLDKFTRSGVHNYDLHVFTDNNHSIATHGAYSEIWLLLKDYLLQAMPKYQQSSNAKKNASQDNL